MYRFLMIILGSTFGLGLAYVGTNRKNVLDLLMPVLEEADGPELMAVASLACGLVAVGSHNDVVSHIILNKLVDVRESDVLKSSYMKLVVLGLGLCYLGKYHFCGQSKVEWPTFVAQTNQKDVVKITAKTASLNIFFLRDAILNFYISSHTGIMFNIMLS